VSKQITVIDGHPDPDPARFCHALADAYKEGAERNGHSVRLIRVGTMDIPFMRSQPQWETDAPSTEIRQCQDALVWAEHVVIVYPLWLGSMPAALKALLEQVLRPTLAQDTAPRTKWTKRLKGRSARIVITMGMPAFLYRLYFRAHSLRSLKRNILGFVGIRPIKTDLIGGIATISASRRRKWLKTMRAYGHNGF
jgi:putative NADPH-quinone reductase